MGPLLAGGLAVLLLASSASSAFPASASPTDRDPVAAGEEVLSVEAALLELRPALRLLERSMRNLHLPDAEARALFTATVDHDDLERGASGPEASGLLQVETWEPTSAERAERDALDLWRPLLEDFAWLDQAKLAYVDGTFGEDHRSLVTELKVALRGRTPAGGIRGATGRLHVLWTRAADRDPWRIRAWTHRPFRFQEAPAPLFRDETDRRIPSPEARARAQRSLHARKLVELVTEPGTRKPYTPFEPHSNDRHPGLAVADVDGDGLDDLFVMPRLGDTLLLRNRGDGTFEDATDRFGLRITNHCAAAIFADFDNDGDADVWVGRSLEPSRFLENQGGRFVDRTRAVLEGDPPLLVSSLAAADVDGDGLLDLYAATYGYGRAPSDLGGDSGLLPGEEDHYLDRTGPPNLLLRNLGGRFEPASAGPEFAIRRNTFHAGFADVDDDGDPDLYLANDFSPDSMLLNDGAGRFRAAPENAGIDPAGFGMGVDFGDFDEDGALDLYVSLMYSKAGKRITHRLHDLDPRVARAARGSALYRNAGGRFACLTDTHDPRWDVGHVGWSWSGRFFDPDRDGRLDIYAPTGFYSAHPSIKVDDDL